MTLRQLRDRLSLVQIALACAAVLAGGAMRWSSIAIAAGFVLWAFYRPLPPEPSSGSQKRWTALVFVALAASSARALLLGEVLDAGVDFLLLLVVQRFFNRQRSREHLQLLALGALLIIVGAVVNTDLNFPVLFAAYLLVACMALIVNHLLSEAERLGRRVQAEVARAGMRSHMNLWRASAGTAGFALLGGLAVFLLFPRFGVGVFLRGSMAQEPRSGFSGDVELGGFGRIKTDPTVIARMRPLDADTLPARLTWYLRGSSLDRYEAGRWTHGREGETTPLHRVSSYLVPSPRGTPVARLQLDAARQVRVVPVPIAGFEASTESVQAQMLLEDQGVDVLFAASDVMGVNLITRGALEQRNRVRGGYNGELRVDKLPGPIQYDFVSRTGTPTASELEAIGSPAPDPELETYLQGRGEFSPRFTELAQELTHDATSRYERVVRIVAYLHGFTYSLDLPDLPRGLAERDPIETFVFDTQAGHCEYFATALAVLLREVGVPTRIVNGYYGAHYNDIGGFYAVRQADAHSWVEVHFDELGWVTFDPTPPVGRVAGDGASPWPAWSQAVDAMRNAYLEYVIDYDLQKQLALFKGLSSNRAHARRMSPDWRRIATVLGVLIVAGAAIRVWRRRSRAPLRVEQRIFATVERHYRTLGFPRKPTESASQWARRLADEGAPRSDAALAFAQLYDALRFGPPHHRADALPQLKRARDEVVQP